MAYENIPDTNDRNTMMEISLADITKSKLMNRKIITF